MDCYGRAYGKKTMCAECELAQYCRDAGDPPLISSVNIDNVQEYAFHNFRLRILRSLPESFAVARFRLRAP